MPGLRRASDADGRIARRGGASLAVKCHNRTRCTFFVRTLSRLSSCGAERDCVSLDPGWGLGWAGHSFARHDVRSVLRLVSLEKDTTCQNECCLVSSWLVVSRPRHW